MFSSAETKRYAHLIEESFACQREGLTIRGTVFRPNETAVPVAVVSHSFMAKQDSVRKYALEIANLGYATFTFDFCGGSLGDNQSDGETTSMSVLSEVRDLEAVMAFAKAQPYTDENRVMLVGCSQGGFVSALAAAQHPSEVGRLILFYPALCIPDDARSGQMMFARFDPADIPETVDCGPMKLGRCYVADVLNMDPFELIKPFRGRVLLLHGTGDTLVKADYSKQAYQAYLDSCPEGMEPDQRARLYLIENGAHGFSEMHDMEALREVRLFARNLRFSVK